MPLVYNLHHEATYDNSRDAMRLPDGENVIASIKPAFANTVQRLRHRDLLRDYLLS